MDAHHVVIVGGGFGGLCAAQSLRRGPVRVTLIDRRNFHLFQPLLYQVATGGLSPANIASPLRSILSNQPNVQVLLGEVVGFEPRKRQVLLSDEAKIDYDSLIVATGSRHHYFGNEHWEAVAPGLKTIEDATEIRRRILLAFEAAEREAAKGQAEPQLLRRLLTFVVVGGGPTGVELAGTLAEIARTTLRYDFRKINPVDAKILLLEGTDRILPPYVPKLSAKATRALERLGVTVRTGAIVKDVSEEGVLVRSGDKEELISTATVLWGAGVKASPLGQKLSEVTGARIDRAGRIIVEPDLSIAGHPEIFVIGDLANYTHQDGKPLPGIAPVAIQQGNYVAKLIKRRIERTDQEVRPFHYRDWGMMATIGRSSAVADLRGVRFSGFLAWLAWLFIHLMYIIEFQNRVLILLQWGWNYFTRNRAARLITGDQHAHSESSATRNTTVDTQARERKTEARV